MPPPRLALFNWHSPYSRLLCLALPDWEVLALATPHAPTGWRDDQRPRPPNLRVVPATDLLTAPPDVMVLQTAMDVAAWEGLAQRPPALYVAHNRAEFDQPGTPQVLQQLGLPLVAISAMKASSWAAAGYGGPIAVILPGIPEDDYGEWTGDDAVVLTVANNLRRPLFDLDAWLEATEGLPVRLIGEGNGGIPGAAGSAASWHSLRWRYQQGRVYLSVNRWPVEDGYNLALLEAMATGMPAVVLPSPEPLAGDVGATAAQCRHLLRCYLGAWGAPFHEWRERQQARVRDRFPFRAFAASWRRMLEEVVR